MSIKRINELPEGSGSLTSDDIFLFMDDPAGGGTTKKISLSQISSAIGGVGSGGNPFDQNLNTYDGPLFNNITISGSQIIGGGTNSGDGNSYGTLELIPDSGLYNNNQYLIVDPTAPNHIHLRAGGTQDNSNAELIIGGEKNNVRVNDQYPLARMQTESLITLNTYYLTPPEFSSVVWETVDGNHRVVINDPTPTVYNAVWGLSSSSDSLFNVIDVSGNYYELTSNGSSTPGGSSPVMVYVYQAPPTSPTTLTQLTFEIRQTRQTSLEANGSDIRIEAADDVRIYSHDLFRLYNYSPNDPIEIFTDYDDQEYRWQFTPSAEFISPNGATIGYLGEGFPGFYNSSSNNPVVIANKNIDSGAEIASAIFQPSPSGGGGLAQIVVAGTGVDYEYWNFKNNGILELGSGGIKFSDNSVLNSASGLGGNQFDQNLNTTDFPTFSGVNLTNNSSLSEGSFDSGNGGNGGISLNCVVGYELNWQASHLRNIVVGDNTGTPQTIYVDSPLQFPGSGSNYMTVDSTGITFPDGSTQTSASSGGGGNSTTVVSLTFNTTLNTDASSGDIFDVTLTDNATLANPTNPVNGKTIRWRVTQDNNGNRTVALGNKFNIPSSASSTLPWSTSANKMDILAATYHSGRDKWDIIAFVPGY